MIYLVLSIFSVLYFITDERYQCLKSVLDRERDKQCVCVHVCVSKERIISFYAANAGNFENQYDFVNS